MYFPYILISMPENAPKGIMDDVPVDLLPDLEPGITELVDSLKSNLAALVENIMSQRCSNGFI